MNVFFTKLGEFTTQSYKFAIAHKIWTGVVLIAVLGGGYFAYSSYTQNAAGSQYVLAAASRGDITVTIEGSGQVEANQQITLSPKASAQVVAVNVTAGDTVFAGQLIASLDATDAQKSLRDAQISLTDAQIAYTQSLSSATKTGTTARADAFDTAGTVVNDLRTIMAGLDAVFYDMSAIPAHTSQQNTNAYASIIGGKTGEAQVKAATASYKIANTSYEKLRDEFKTLSRTSPDADLTKLIADAYQAVSETAETVKQTLAILNTVDDRLSREDVSIPASFTANLASVNSYTTTLTTDIGNSYDAKTALEEALSTLGDGSDSLDVVSAKLALAKAENTYTDARDALEDYVVRAPFGGTIAAVDVHTFDQVSSGTTIATLVTNEQYAQLSLNEVDAAKIKKGQKATLTFDAIDGLTLSGTVAEIDSLGTVTSGVVTYNVRISFDEQDARIKPGMTVNATIVTASKENVLTVPASAIQTSGNQSYVQVVEAHTPMSSAQVASSSERFGSASSTSLTPRRITMNQTETVSASSVTLKKVPVTVGIQDDTTVEIVDGIQEGTQVVTRTTSGTTAPSASAASSGTKAPTGGFGRAF